MVWLDSLGVLRDAERLSRVKVGNVSSGVVAGAQVRANLENVNGSTNDFLKVACNYERSGAQLRMFFENGPVSVK